MELNNHGLEVFDRQSQQLSVLSRHRGELTLHFVKSVLPVFIVDVCVLLDVMDDVYESEREPSGYFYVHQVQMLWEHVTATTFLQKVDMSYVVTFEMDVFFVVLDLAL